MAGGKASRRKGDRVEYKIRDRFRKIGLEAERVPLSGAAGGEFGSDLKVEVPGLGSLKIEVKARKGATGWKGIKGWLGDDNDALVLAEDREEPLVVLPWLVWAAIMDRLMGVSGDADREADGDDQAADGPGDVFESGGGI